MEAINLLRKLSIVNQTRHITSSYVEKEINIFKDKPKFLLPLDGVVLNIGADLKGISDFIALPFQQFVVEYQTVVSDELLEVLNQGGIVLPDVHKNKTEILSSTMLFVEQLDDMFSLRSITHIKGDKGKDNELWELPSFKAFVNNVVDNSVSDGTGLIISFDEKSQEFKEGAGFPIFESHPDSFHQIFKIIYLQSIMAVLELSVALECKNITHSPLPGRKLNKGAKKKGALPFDSYRVLTVKAYGKEKAIQFEYERERKTAREHLRRGHIRKLPNGNKIYVSPTVVNAGIGGKINKDYLVK